MDLATKSEFFCLSIVGQFHSRTVMEYAKRGESFPATMSHEIKNNSAFFKLATEEETFVFQIPLPFLENNVLLLEQNEVRRAVCPYLLKNQDLILDYYAVMSMVVNDTQKCKGILTNTPIKKVSLIQQLAYSFENNNTSTVIYNIQKAINDIVNRMPLHETYLNSWVMNHRVMIVDEVFNSLRSPEDRLQYQIDKSKEYFDRGWTSIGLADGNLADKNYILATDIRKLTPFGPNYHNPQRNLYSTLKMKGDEMPKVSSQSMENLHSVGIKRTGWNWFTLFADIPDVFEDQIMVDISHRSKYINFEKRFQCFGQLKVRKGNKLVRGMTMSISDKAVAKKFNIDCDLAKVVRVSASTVSVGGVETPVHNVIVECRRYLRDGMKVTNLHGNKGIIRMKELGYAVHPATGDLRKIDIIVSAKSIEKRKNDGQILEAVFNNLHEGHHVLPDDAEVDINAIKALLADAGMPKDGTWHCETYVGGQDGVCGEVFWGIIASVENSLWDEGAVLRRNTRDLRTAGLKLSHVEFRGLMTRFGKNNAIMDEILSYAQGSDDLHELMDMLRSKKGILPADKPRVSVKDLPPVDQSHGTIIDEELIAGTVVDDEFMSEGFILDLPVNYGVYRNDKGEILHEGIPADMDGAESFVFNQIYVPKGALRRCWKHDTGKYGMNDIGALLNNIIVLSHRLMADPNTQIHWTLVYKSIYNYFSRLASMMSMKKGEIARLGMAVRYPMSAKATATLSNRVPSGVIEIHEDMAEQLAIKNGDVVLVERFPCFGFMSIRPQKVRITKDEMARYTIRVSGNCLCSLGLDFDGDVIYLASFHTPEAKELLRKEWEKPNAACWDIICQLNEKVGAPKVANLTLDDYNISKNEPLTIESHAAIISNLTGVKSHTGPVVALAYNIMRILENSELDNDQDIQVAVEYFLDRVGNTVFKQKHGVKSLHQIVKDAICSGDVDTLVKEGFDAITSEKIIGVIRKKAHTVGVSDLAAYHKLAMEKGWSNIINRIVREQNKIYYASRADLEGCLLLDHIETEAVDVPSRILKTILSGRAEQKKTCMEDIMDERSMSEIKDDNIREACAVLIKEIDQLCSQPDVIEDSRSRMRSCLTLLGD